MNSRKVFIASLFISAFVLSCGGSGKRLTQQREVLGFHSIELSGPMRVYVYMEPSRAKPVLTLSGDDNIVSRVETEVKEGILHVRFPKGYVIKTPVEVRLTLAELKGIGVSLTGEIEAVVQGPRVEKMSVDVRGRGDLTLRGIDAGTLVAKINGVGNMSVKGSAKSLNFVLSGVGRADFGSLCADEADVTVNGAGKVTVSSKSSLRAAITGGGNVYYYGDPVISPDITGRGSVNHLDDTPPCDLADE